MPSLGLGLGLLNSQRLIMMGRKVNLLGDDGVLDSLTGWDISGTVELDSNIKYVGTKSAKFTPAGALCRMQKDYYNTLAEKYYIAIANVYIQSYSEGIIRLQITNANSLTDPIRTDANTALLNQWQPLLVRFRKTNFRYWIGSTSASTTAVYYFDGLSVYEVSENEYNSFTDEQLISKYNY
jgi:hypothetical protein